MLARISTLLAATMLLGFGAAPAATLTGSFASLAGGSNVNLSTLGPVDWIHWGQFTETDLDRKAAVVTAISHYAIEGNVNPNSDGPFQRPNDLATSFTWQDGAQTVFVTNTPTGVYIIGKNNGFSFTVPADTTTRVVRVYVATQGGAGKLTATLSDGSAGPYSPATLAAGSEGVYTITNSATSASGTLTVKWIGTANASVVTLSAATLAYATANNPPIASVIGPAANSIFPTTGNIIINAAASDTDGSVTNVQFFTDGTLLGETNAPPYSFTWSNPSPGLHRLGVRLFDNAGASQSSGLVEVFVHSGGGSLSGVGGVPDQFVDLTTLGSNDWTHWGLSTSNSFDRRAAVVGQISNFVAIGTNVIRRYADNYSRYTWADGTPTGSATDTPTGVFVFGHTNGFLLRFPASPVPRSLKLYVGLFAARGNLQAYLSDGSAPAFTDNTFSNRYNNAYRVYTLDYAAASAGQTLFVRYTTDKPFDYAFGNVTLQSATLVGADTANLPPVASNLSVTLPEDTGTNLTLTGSDVEGSSLTFTVVSGPAHGAVTAFNTNTGALTYMPATNYSGADSFTFSVKDGALTSSVAMVSLNVTPVNDAPFASNQIVTLPEQTTAHLTLAGFDVEGSALTFTLVSGPTNGSLSGFDTDTGAIFYTPTGAYLGPDSFTFSVNDGALTSAVANVSLAVLPLVSNLSATLPEDTPTNLVLPILTQGGTNLSFAIVVGPAHGGISGFNTNSGALTYTPNTNFFGPDSFTFSVSDGQLTSLAATVTLTITNVNDAPVATNQSHTLPEDTATNLTLTGFDVEGSNLTFTVVRGPTNGALSGFNTSTGTLTYTPNTNFLGIDSFTFSVSDSALTSAVATVSLAVLEVSSGSIDIVSALLSGTNGLAFSFTTDSGRGYTVEFTDSFQPTNWLFHTNLTGDGSLMSIVIPDITTLTNRFYRVRR